MTVTSSSDKTPVAQDLVTLTIDGESVSVPKGTLIIRAAEELGNAIPRFCDHPLLDPVGACRQCLVEVSMKGPDGSMRPMPKPQASCTMEVAEGMEVKTQKSSAVADKAQHGVMELLLINHPLDCPVCDKGGECPLQNQAMSNGAAKSRFEDVKRTYPKPINISSQVLLDRERCVLCARCTRFSDQIAGDPFIALIERGALQQVGIYEEKPFESYFSGNTVQICPVGALTGAAYRFRSRPFDLVSTPSVCEHCASGCSLRTDHRRGVVLRRMALDTPEVNEEWNCDKGRWAFKYVEQNRLQTPLVRDENGELRVAGWPEAIVAAAEGLAKARDAHGVGSLVGGRLTTEDAYAYSKFTRLVLGSNDIDFRARPHSAEEAEFLAHAVAGVSPDNGGVTYADLEKAGAVLLVGFEPEDESPIVFLRLRKAFRKNKTKVVSLAPFATRGLEKMGGTLVPTAPGTEAEVLAALAAPDGELNDVAEQLRTDGELIVLVGERMATSTGALSAVASFAATKDARLAWVPRRAGERGAIEAGALPNMLPGARQVTDAGARSAVGTVWGSSELPQQNGRDTTAMLAAAAKGELSGLLVAGVDVHDLPNQKLAREALTKAFVVSTEIRESSVLEYADVVLPVAPQQEKSGSYLDWEGRVRIFERALDTQAMGDHRVLDLVAAELGEYLGTRSVKQIREEIAEIGTHSGDRAVRPRHRAGGAPRPLIGEAILATWPTLLDKGSMQDGEPFLAGTARRSVARMSAATAQAAGVADGEQVEVSSRTGSVTVPVAITAMPDHVVWLPTNSENSQVRRALDVDAGAAVALRKAGAQ